MLDLMRFLRDRGHEVRCVVSGWNDGDFIRRLQELGVAHDVVKLGFLYLSRPRWTLDSLVHYPGSLLQLARIMAAFEPDVVYHHGYRTLLTTFFLTRPQRTIVHMMETEGDTRRVRLRYRALRSRAARFVAISRFIERDLIAKGIDADQIRVAYPAVQIGGLDRRAAPAETRLVRVGVVGQLIPRKGHLDLFQALGALRAEGHAFALDVFGRGPDDWTAELTRAARRSGLESCTTWHGFVSERAQIYAGLDLVVVPTRDQEALGMVAAEPALWSIPVIASDGGGLPEVVIDGETGLLFRAGDVAHLIDRLRSLLSDAPLRRRLGTNAKLHVERRFGADACTSAIEAVIDEVCAR
jgi:glycosyltransferase involved in cell wall biosynthesis